MKILKDEEIMPAVRKKLAGNISKKRHFLGFFINESKSNRKEVQNQINGLMPYWKYLKKEIGDNIGKSC